MISKRDYNRQCITYNQMNMISNSRLFWRRFTTWIRVYIVSRYVGIGTEEEAFSRVYSETSGIGNFLQVTYELAESNNVARNLTQIVISIRDIITAQIQGNIEAMNQSVDRLYQSAENFATYLASINLFVNEDEWIIMMRTYVQYTIEQANSFATRNFRNDIELFRRLTELTNRMGELFAEANFNYINSGGQVTLPPGVTCITYEQMNQIYSIRMFWFELVTWVRAYMLSRYRGIGNENEIKARLKQVPIEYINVLQQFFGGNLDNYLNLLNTYIDLIDALITAQLQGNNEEVGRIVQLLNQNADQRVKEVSSLSPFWNESEWRNRLYNNNQTTIEESLTFLTGDYTRNLDVFRTLLDQAESVSAYFTRGLYFYLTNQDITQ